MCSCGKALAWLVQSPGVQSPMLQQPQDKQDLGGLGVQSITFLSLFRIHPALMLEGMTSARLRVPGKFNKMTHVKVTCPALGLS